MVTKKVGIINTIEGETPFFKIVSVSIRKLCSFKIEMNEVCAEEQLIISWLMMLRFSLPVLPSEILKQTKTENKIIGFIETVL